MSLLKSGVRSAEAERHFAGASVDVPERGRLVVDVDGTPVGVFRVGSLSLRLFAVAEEAGKVYVAV
jgi:hypothetical protein